LVEDLDGVRIIASAAMVGVEKRSRGFFDG